MGKGRDAELIKKRDEALCRRYVYWTEVQRLRFDDVLINLSEQEFFISQERILNIIRRAKKLPEHNNIALPKNKQPRLTYKQLALFSNDPEFSLEQIHRESRTYK